MNLKSIILSISILRSSLYADTYDVLRKNCVSHKNGEACYQLGLYYKTGNDGQERPDHYGAVKYYKMACKMGNAKGCLSISQCYHVGKALPIDQESENRYLNLSCKYGYIEACKKISTNNI